jgi:hypothetical protein
LALDVGQILQGLGATANDVAGALESAYDFISADIVAADLDELGYAASDIAHALHDVFGLSVDDIESLFTSIGGDLGGFVGCLADPTCWL